jgi:hypothetical protein
LRTRDADVSGTADEENFHERPLCMTRQPFHPVD